MENNRCHWWYGWCRKFNENLARILNAVAMLSFQELCQSRCIFSIFVSLHSTAQLLSVLRGLFPFSFSAHSYFVSIFYFCRKIILFLSYSHFRNIKFLFLSLKFSFLLLFMQPSSKLSSICFLFYTRKVFLFYDFLRTWKVFFRFCFGITYIILYSTPDPELRPPHHTAQSFFSVVSFLLAFCIFRLLGIFCESKICAIISFCGNLATFWKGTKLI